MLDILVRVAADQQARPSDSDGDLLEWLSACEDEVVALLIVSLRSKLSIESHTYFAPYRARQAPIPAAGTADRRQLAGKIVDQLGYFGAHTAVYYARKVLPLDAAPGAPYAEVLREVEDVLYERLAKGRKPARVATIADREQSIAELLLRSALEDVPRAELIAALTESGLDDEGIDSTLVALTKPAVEGSAALVLGRLVGKKAVRDLMLASLVKIVTLYTGKEGATQLALQLAKRVPQKAFLRLSNAVGYALLAYDLWQLAGPAKRQTVPAVAAIACLRSIERLER